MAKQPYIFRTTRQKFEEVDTKLLRYSRPCKAGHCDPEGRGVRLIHSGSCIACKYKMDDGPFEHNFGDDVRAHGLRKYSEEEGKARHIARVMAWQKANKDKVRPVQAKYNAKEETKARCRAHYQANKEKQQDRQREYYRTHREEVLQKARDTYLKKQEEKLKEQNEITTKN